MPNVQISVYLNDNEYTKYLKQKEELNEIARAAFKHALGEV